MKLESFGKSRKYPLADFLEPTHTYQLHYAELQCSHFGWIFSSDEAGSRSQGQWHDITNSQVFMILMIHHGRLTVTQGI